MATEAQTLANRRLGRRIVLNLGHFDFDFRICLPSVARRAKDGFRISILGFRISTILVVLCKTNPICWLLK